MVAPKDRWRVRLPETRDDFENFREGWDFEATKALVMPDFPDAWDTRQVTDQRRRG